MQTLKLSISDAAIKRAAKDNSIRQIKDLAKPLLVRFHKDRTKASWYVRQGQKFKKLGCFPELTTKTVINRLPDLLIELALDKSTDVTIGTFEDCEDVLNWYRKRMLKDRDLSKKRKKTTQSVIDKHLLPLIGELSISSVNHAEIDDKLIWWLQQRYSLSNVRLIFAVLKVAFKTAAKQRRIETNPLADLNFTDFIKAKILPKDSAIRADALPEVLKSARNTKPAIKHLVLLMVMYGTRIGETRKAKWSHFDDRHWFIPAENTKTKQSHRLPLTKQTIAILKDYKEQQKRQGYNGQYLFPNSKHDGNCLSSSSSSSRIKKVSSGKWSAHDLRKVARSCWADLGVDYMVGEMLLNHALSKLDKTYIHTHVEHKMREALQQYHDWLDNL